MYLRPHRRHYQVISGQLPGPGAGPFIKINSRNVDTRQTWYWVRLWRINLNPPLNRFAAIQPTTLLSKYLRNWIIIIFYQPMPLYQIVCKLTPGSHAVIIPQDLASLLTSPDALRCHHHEARDMWWWPAPGSVGLLNQFNEIFNPATKLQSITMQLNIKWIW